MLLLDKAYAKLNLFLSVDSKREDGYHNISSIMQTVSLCDKLAIELDETQESNLVITSSEEVSGLPLDDSNIIAKTVKIFYETIGKPMPGISVVLSKKIPIGAGLAGGSADAAAVLRSLNKYYNFPISESKILKVAATIGADVPFCVHGGTALCQGIGEAITHLGTAPSSFYVIAVGKEKKNTGEIYRLLDQKFPDAYPDTTEILKKLQMDIAAQNVTNIGHHLYNVFEEVQLERIKDVKEIKKILLDSHALGACMSGSGPSVYGIFDNERQAEVTKTILSAFGYESFVATPVENNLSSTQA